MSFQADHHDTRSWLPSREARGGEKLHWNVQCTLVCSEGFIKHLNNWWRCAHMSSFELIMEAGSAEGQDTPHNTQCNGSKANGILIMWPNQPGKRLFPTLALRCTQDSAGFGRKWRVRCRGVSLNYDRRKRINWLIELYKGRDRNNTRML